jgi:mannose/fructose/N-acetylgalactosamine-specific phosphotransferase system component IIC
VVWFYAKLHSSQLVNAKQLATQGNIGGISVVVIITCCCCTCCCLLPILIAVTCFGASVRKRSKNDFVELSPTLHQIVVHSSDETK